jgi:hypothetical protein
MLNKEYVLISFSYVYVHVDYMMQSFRATSRDDKQATTVNKQFSHIFYLHECAQKAPVYICLSQLNGDGGD